MSAVLQTPSERLARSREQLRLSLQAAPALVADIDGTGAASTAPTWLDALKSNPGTRVVIDVVSHWWAKHPLRLAAIVATTAATAAIKPIAQRHPLGLVAGAAVLGILIAWCRPWRWSRPALLAGLLPQLLLAAVRAAPPQSDPAPPS
jgi:hypothetical protein